MEDFTLSICTKIHQRQISGAVGYPFAGYLCEVYWKADAAPSLPRLSRLKKFKKEGQL